MRKRCGTNQKGWGAWRDGGKEGRGEGKEGEVEKEEQELTGRQGMSIPRGR
jgi:hypothetical protein